MADQSDLAMLGFREGFTVETILSTFNEDNTPNAAPMGVVTSGPQVVVKPFKTTITYKNLIRSRCAVINVTDDPFIFYRTVFKGPRWGERSQLLFTRARKVDAPKLKDALAFLEVQAESVEEDSAPRARILFKVLSLTVNRLKKPEAHNRAAAALTESIIHATRIRAALRGEQGIDVARLIEMIEHYSKIVSQVAPNSEYEHLMRKIIRRIEAWRSVSSQSKS